MTMSREQAMQKWTGLSVVAIDGCWLWTGYTVHGYGYFRLEGKSVRAGRWGYEQLVGPIPDGLHLDHLCHTFAETCEAPCRHRSCVNPIHLEPVTQAENNRRAGLSPTGRKSRKLEPSMLQSHCSRGHLYTPETTIIHTQTGTRYCRTCRNLRRQARRAVA